MSEHITYIIDMELPDILAKLSEEADLLRDGNDCASDDELADLFGDAAEEIARLRKEIGEALYRNQEADKEIKRMCQVYKDDTQKFNAGCLAYDDGLPYTSAPDKATHDQWRVGWAWAKFQQEPKP